MIHIKINKGLLVGFLFSVFIHISFFAFLFYGPLGEDPVKDTEDDLVTIEYLPHRQLVTQEKFNKVRLKEQKKAYLSKADKVVEKETQAMLKGLFHQSSMMNSKPVDGSPSVAKTAQNSRAPAMEPLASMASVVGRGLAESRGYTYKRQILPSRESSFSKEALSRESLAKQAKDMPIQLELGGHSFAHSENDGPSRTMDFLPNVEGGSHTLLNTKGFTYYSYFTRMKEQLYWQWTEHFKEEAASLYTRLTQKKRSGIFHTSLSVYISPEGEIQDIGVVKSSGEESIDDIALFAFLRAAPFPNPPEELVKGKGYIHLKQSFILNIKPLSSSY